MVVGPACTASLVSQRPANCEGADSRKFSSSLTIDLSHDSVNRRLGDTALDVVDLEETAAPFPVKSLPHR